MKNILQLMGAGVLSCCAVAVAQPTVQGPSEAQAQMHAPAQPYIVYPWELEPGVFDPAKVTVTSVEQYPDGGSMVVFSPLPEYCLPAVSPLESACVTGLEVRIGSGVWTWNLKGGPAGCYSTYGDTKFDYVWTNACGITTWTNCTQAWSLGPDGVVFTINLGYCTGSDVTVGMAQVTCGNGHVTDWSLMKVRTNNNMAKFCFLATCPPSGGNCSLILCDYQISTICNN